MEVVPTSDGEEDDGVIWFRCPQCQGFLPKLSGADLQTDSKDASFLEESSTDDEAPGAPGESPAPADVDDAMLWESPADMMATQQEATPNVPFDELADPVAKDTPDDAVDKTPSAKPVGTAEPLHEYAALLAQKDQSEPTPYRPWESYEVGQCIHHQAWEECGVVVAKEKLPGNRQVIKCYFEEAGVVRLIEMAPC
jgi:hypothetical protein